MKFKCRRDFTINKMDLGLENYQVEKDSIWSIKEEVKDGVVLKNVKTQDEIVINEKEEDNFREYNKIKLFTSDSLDGVGCTIALEYKLSEVYDSYAFETEYFKKDKLANKKIKEFLNSDEADEYAEILIFNIMVDKSIITILNDYYFDSDINVSCLINKNIDKQILKDLKNSGININKMEFCFCDSMYDCTTEMVCIRHLPLSLHYSDAKQNIKANLNMLRTLIGLYKSKTKENEHFELARKYKRLFDVLGFNNFRSMLDKKIRKSNINKLSEDIDFIIF